MAPSMTTYILPRPFVESLIDTFLDEDNESLKRKLYDRLKQGCFRLGYRPNKNAPSVKCITCPEYDGECGTVVERSELSTLTDRTNSSKSDLFYVCDGQWRSGDWSYMAATTMSAKRQKALMVTRRRQVHFTTPESLAENIEEHVATTTKANLVHNSLPWFPLWILSLTILLLTHKSLPSRLRNIRRKQQNQKNVRSGKRRSSPLRRSHSTTPAIRPIIPATKPNLMLLAKSLPTITKRSSSDGSTRTQMISKQCAAVARVSRIPVTGLPQRPRLIMTPPNSPLCSPRRSVSVKKSQSEPVSPMSIDIGSSSPGDGQQQQLIRILSESPRKIVIEIENSKGLKGLLSQHFATKEGNRLDALAPPAPDVIKDSKNSCDGAPDAISPDRPQRGQEVATCSGRTTTNVASGGWIEEKQEQEQSPVNLSRPIPSRKTRAIELLKAKKREMARSRDSQGSVDGDVGSMERQRQTSGSLTPSEDEALAASSSSSLLEDIHSQVLEKWQLSGPWRSDSGITASSSSSFTLDADMPSISAQTYNLIRVNSRCLGKDPVGSLSSSNWKSIDEEPSMESTTDSNEPPPSSPRMKRQKSEAQEREKRKSTLLKMEMPNPEMKPSAQKRTISPFARQDQQRPRQTRPAPDAETKQDSSPPTSDKSSPEDSITEPRPIAPKNPPPPPKKKKQTVPIAKNRPPPPSKSTAKGNKGPAPPPPPPGSKRDKGRDRSGYKRSTEVIRIFQEVRKISKKGPFQPRTISTKSSDLSSQGSAGETLIKELEKSSSHFANIQADVETHGTAICQMIRDINSLKFETMSELSTFVKRIDAVLETFADETAVLKQFEWPHKYYVYRESLALWLELRTRADKCHKWVQGPRGMSAELNKMKKHMELNIRRLEDVKRTLDAEERKFVRNGIPWDSSIIQKVNDGTMCLLEKYMQIVRDEVERTQTKASHRERNLQYLTDTVNLTFKIHQFVGGLTESCSSLFERIACFTRTLTNM